MPQSECQGCAQENQECAHRGKAWDIIGGCYWHRNGTCPHFKKKDDENEKSGAGSGAADVGHVGEG